MLLGLAVLLLTAGAMGAIFRRIGQPPVIGEIVGGILLGPTLLGAVPGNPSAALFTPSTRSAIDALGQVGVVCYVFSLGLDINLVAVRLRSRLITSISTASLLTPFLLALPVGLVLYHSDGAAAARGIGKVPFALFIGLAFSITAVPVLARILADRGMDRMRLAHATLASAVIQDLAGWLLLAAVLTMVKVDRGGGSLLTTVLGSVGVLAALLLVVRPLASHWWRYRDAAGRSPHGEMTGLLALAVLSSAASSAVGLQPIVGAVLCGLACGQGMGENRRDAMLVRMRPLIQGVLLPAYFLAPGLVINFRAIGPSGLAEICGMVALASVCKIGGASLASRSCGLSWRQAGIVGVLMNARGLVELVVLRIGYSAGLLSTRLFGELIAMAVITTLITGPLLNVLTEGVRRRTVTREFDLPALPELV